MKMKGRQASHSFAKVPHAEIPRSTFTRSHGYKTTFDAGFLIPFYVDEALPGDTFNCNVSIFARLATPVAPIMDNLYMDIFFFACPNRLIWDNWQKFCGEQLDPGDSIDFLVPIVESDAALGWYVESMFDYMGLRPGQANSHASALPMRAYNRIWNDWFRDENLQDRANFATDDGPDNFGEYPLKRRGKRHDYFTSALPWPQKGVGVDLPLGTVAPVVRNASTATPGFEITDSNSDIIPIHPWHEVGGAPSPATTYPANIRGEYDGSHSVTDANLRWSGVDVGLEADLTGATAASINSLRQAFQIQKLLERDARGGTRYVELIKSHFGVTSPDFRLQRPEFLQGGSAPVNISPVAQTSATAGSAAQGSLSAFGTVASARFGFSKSFVEHTTIIGLVAARADLTYQQGQQRMFSRRTRYDFFWPAFSHLGEQAILNKEIYMQGEDVLNGDSPPTPIDDDVFGYQERWAEYRYFPSLITGKFRSDYSSSLDFWHLAQEFTSLPVLNDAFMQDTPDIGRISAVSTEPHFIFDSYFDIKVARPMPTYSIPGLIDHF